MKKLFIIFVFSAYLGPVFAFEEEANENDQIVESSEIQLSFNVSNNLLEKHSDSEQQIRIDVNGNEHLVMQYPSKGRKQRGNVLLLHAEGESPVNNRLIQPLAKQLSKLGWKLYIPNIAREDYPKLDLARNIDPGADNLKGTQETKTDKNSSKESESTTTTGKEIERYFFEDSITYQNYFVSLCKAIFEQTTILEQPTLLIANQHSAYWSIDCLQHTNEATPIVFLAALLPNLPKNDLDEKFTKQTSSVFSFKLNSSLKDHFSKAFNKQNWISKSQRSNIGMLSSTKLSIEDDSIARSVTGWIEKLRKNNR